MSSLEVKMIDIHEWDTEESMDKRRDEKEKMRKELEKSVRANGGNVGMIKGMLKAGVTDPRKHKCAASFVWHSIKQDDPKSGETAYTSQAGWKDRATNWAPLLETAKGISRGIESGKMKDLIGDDQKTISQELRNMCQQDLIAFEQSLIAKTTGVVRPRLRLKSYKIGQCEVQLGDAEVEDRRYPSNIYPNLNGTSPSTPSAVEGLLGAMVPTLKTLSAAGGKYIEMNRMKAKPGRKK